MKYWLEKHHSGWFSIYRRSGDQWFYLGWEEIFSGSLCASWRVFEFYAFEVEDHPNLVEVNVLEVFERVGWGEGLMSQNRLFALSL